MIILNTITNVGDWYHGGKASSGGKIAKSTSKSYSILELCHFLNIFSCDKDTISKDKTQMLVTH